MNIIEAVYSRELYQPWFPDPSSWRAWFIVIKALFGIPLSADDMALWTEITGRTDPPSGAFLELWLICGRRSGKSIILAMLASYLATMKDWQPYLSPGERGVVLILASDRAQAGVIFRYLRSMMLEIPAFADLVTRETADTIELSNGITIEVGTASFRGVRGRTIIAALLDEACFWRSESTVNPDREILDAIRPAMATVPDGLLLVASSPYSRKGIVFDAYRKFYGVNDPSVLVVQAPTRTMNPTVPQRVIDAANERDPVSAAAEFGAQWRTDISAFLTRDVIDACTFPGRHELPPISSTTYTAFVDPSGGSADSMTIAVAHKDGDKAVLDAVREVKPPFSPEGVVQDFCALLKSYRVSKVTGDRYAGEWPREQFRKQGIEYLLSDKPKSDIYRDLLPILNSGKAELLDLPRLHSQFCGLERRTARGGRDSIDHPPAGHDDLANAVAGALLLVGKGGGFDPLYRWVSDGDTLETMLILGKW